MRYVLVLVLLPLAWLGGAMAVLQLSTDPHSWVWSVWGEQHPAWDLLTAVIGLSCAGIVGWTLAKWANR